MYIPGDLIFFVYSEAGEQVQTGGIVVSYDDFLLTVALPHGVEIINMRSSIFGRSWRVEHAPYDMTSEEAIEFSKIRLEQLVRTPPMLVHPLDEGYRPSLEHDHEHEHVGAGRRAY